MSTGSCSSLRATFSTRPGGRLVLAAVADCPRRLAQRDHEHEDETGDEHPEDDVTAFFGGVCEQPGDHERELTNRFACAASASSTVPGPGSPPSRRTASTQASPSPEACSARRCAH